MEKAPLISLSDISEYDKAYAEEDLLLRATESIAELLLENDHRQSDLAVALGVSEARVSQMMSGEANPTLKTLARVGLVLDRTISLEFEERKMVGQFNWTPLPVDESIGEDVDLGIAA